MMLNEFLKNLRIGKDYSYADIADKLGFARATINNVEKGRAPISENLLKAYIKLFPEHKNELLKFYLEEKIPEDVEEKIKIESESKIIEQLPKGQNIKIYNYDSSGYGRVNLEEYKVVAFMLDQKIAEGSLLIEVTEKFMEPYFIEGDILLFERETFVNWQNFNRKLIFVEFEKTILIRKLIFKNTIPYLVAFNDEVYPDMEVNEKIFFLGQLSELLKRKKIKDINF